jgi:hypothetical protein
MLFLMQLEKKALYNLLRLNWRVDPSLEVEAWQVANLRDASMEKIFEELGELGIAMDEATFGAYADECDTPEELADLLTEEETDIRREDHIYLLLFELWRRLAPEKQSLSIFCDELDHLIDRYDREEEVPELEDALVYLQDILADNVDEGVDVKEVAARLGTFLASDLEDFLHDYISEQIDEGHMDYASDLLEEFAPFMTDERWADLLQMRIWSATEPGQAHQALENLLSYLKDEPDLDLLLEIAHHAIHVGDDTLFKHLIEVTVPLLEVESDLVALLERCATYCESTGACDLSEEIEQMLFSRDRDPLAPLIDEDSFLRRLCQLIGFEPA